MARKGDTLLPLADQFQTISNSSSWTFSTLANCRDLSTKAASGFASISNSSSWTFSTLKSSGYQIVLAVTGPQSVSRDEPLNLSDSASLTVPLSNDDALNLSDSTTMLVTLSTSDSLNLSDDESIATPGGPTFVGNDDALNLADSISSSIGYDQPDALNLSDSVIQTIALTQSDSLNLSDSPSAAFTLSTSDSFNLSDDADAGLSVSASDSLDLADSVSLRKGWYVKYSTAVLTKHAHVNKYSTEVQVQHYDPAPINDLSSISNGASPTLVLNGDYVVQNSTTDKGSAGQYISLNESQLDPNCHVKRWSLNYQIGGGTFSITSATSFTQVGSIINLFGIPCLVTDIDDESSDTNGEVTSTSGIISNSANINKEILLVLDTSSLIGIKPLFPNTPLQSAVSVQWTSVAGAARAIADYAGISLNWAVRDAPLIDTFLETGMTVIQALQSLAARVNGLLTFDGSNNWIVFNPSLGYGGWNPNLGEGCGLWGKNGLKVKRSLDFKKTSVTVPIQPAVNGSVTYVANPLTANPPIIQHIKSFKSPVENDTLIPIPGDNQSDLTGAETGTAFNTYRQILMPTQDAQVIGNTYVPGQIVKEGVTRVAGDTLDPSEWTPYVLPVVKDTKGVSYWVIRPSDFDDNLSAPDFEYKIGYRQHTKPLADAYQQQVQELQQRQALYAQYQQEKVRYFPAYTAVAEFVFFGSVPIPGNNVSFTKGTRSFTGTVDSVSISGDVGSVPMMVVSGTQNIQINQLTPKAQVDWFLATGGGLVP